MYARFIAIDDLYSMQINRNRNWIKTLKNILTFLLAVPPESVRLRVVKQPVEEGQNNDVICTGEGGLFKNSCSCYQ